PATSARGCSPRAVRACSASASRRSCTSWFHSVRCSSCPPLWPARRCSPATCSISPRRAGSPMPEGDTVYQATRRLDEAPRGDIVTRFDLRVPAAATVDLTGELVHSVVPRGKRILMRIGDQTLHSHLRMDGAWRLYWPGEKWRHPAFKVRATVGTARR